MKNMEGLCKVDQKGPVEFREGQMTTIWGFGGQGGEPFQEIIILHPTMATVGYFIIVINKAQE